MEWSNQQIEHWRDVWKSYLMDASSVALHQEVYQRRRHIQQDMIQLLHSFFNDAITLKEFNATFQQKTHGEWNVFGLRGISGGMFLSKLVKYVSDKNDVTSRLQKLLRAPTTSDIRYGQRRMQAFVHFLDELIATQQVTRVQLQPSRVPFLLSAWWHLQDTEQWPIFYPIVHAVLACDADRSNIVQEPIESYFVFRRRFLSLANALGLSSWELEHLCTWYGQKYLKERNVSRENVLALSMKRRLSLFSQEPPNTITLLPEAVPVVNILAAEAVLVKDEQESSSHTHIQWLLAKIGKKVGCQVWIAINDHSKVWKHERLGDLSLKSLPILKGSEFQRIVSRIDVLWLQNDEVVAAYEIEHTTEIYTGLLRLYDLGSLFPKQNVQLCVVIPKDRIGRVQFELSRPTFYEHDMRKLCAILYEETLVQHEEHILRWAGSPTVVQDLIALSAQENTHGLLEVTAS